MRRRGRERFRRLSIAFLTILYLGCSAQRGTIGAMLGRRSDGRVFVRETPSGLAAEQGGVVEGDEILLIDGVDVRLLDDRRLHEALSGEVGDPVKLTLLRGERIVRVTLKRTVARRPKLGADAGESAPVTEP